jgi:membrane fusion protein (multidrug efflux system)
VTVSADLPGIVARIDFESGRTVQKGDVLVKLDSRQEEAQLQAAKAELELAALQLERMRGLLAKGVTSQAEYDAAAAAHTQAEARVGEIRATLDRKVIRAPFSGLLGIRQVNLGQYLNAGDAVVPLQTLDPIYVDFSVPQQRLAALTLGTPVTVSADGVVSDVAGRVSAVDSVADAATRNVNVQASFGNAGGELRPGMFVEVRAKVGAASSAISLPASAISYAPYGDSVYVVAEMENPDGQTYKGVRQQFVKLGASRGDQVAVLSGVEAGAEVVTSGVFKLRNGAAVLVNNDVQPANDPAPMPENS